MLSLLYLGVKAQQHFVSLSCMFLEKKTLVKTWLIPGVKLTILLSRNSSFGPKDTKTVLYNVNT